MGAEPGRRSLKMPAEKLGPVIGDTIYFHRYPESDDLVVRQK